MINELRTSEVMSLHSKVINTIPYIFKTQIISNNMKKLPNLKELPKNMSEIKEDRSEISLQDLIDNFYT